MGLSLIASDDMKRLDEIRIRRYSPKVSLINPWFHLPLFEG
jgi:hypothetical protein